MTPLPEAFLTRPIAHRALHGAGKPENSRAAISAAIAQGFGIEIDIQRSRDGVPMVFHDYDLRRLTLDSGPIAQRSAAELGAIPLLGTRETVPTLQEVLELVEGQVPLLIEIKDQDGALGASLNGLERAVADLLLNYSGPAAVMSFNPNSVQLMSRYLPDHPTGMVTCAFNAEHWPTIAAPTRERLAKIPDFDISGASFISHNHHELDSARIAELKTQAVPILCWTITSAEAETAARRVADNITFEGYLP